MPLSGRSTPTADGSARTSSASSAVRVTVRVRPPPEGARGVAEAVDVSSDSGTLTLDHGDGRPPRAMRFDSVHGRETTQREFFERCGLCDQIDAALDGYSATVFAFGQTGSGKTYTMAGKAAEAPRGVRGGAGPVGGEASRQDGLMQRAARRLYAQIGEREAQGQRFTVRATFLEIYNEQVHDLVEPASGALGVRGSTSQGFYVEDLSVVQCRGLHDLEYVISQVTACREMCSQTLPTPALDMSKTPARRLSRHSRGAPSLDHITA